VLIAKKVLSCAQKNSVEHNNILTIIDYSKPSNEKRLWVFDLAANKVLYHTYVSHGIRSGKLQSDYFSNKNNSKTSSIGVYTTDFSYVGRYGVSVKLHGQEKAFNNNAYNRFLVIHPAWYVTEEFINKYGRLGRSWGCPAIPYQVVEPLINTIKEKSLLIVYYPDQQWLAKSSFLNCDNISLVSDVRTVKNIPEEATEEIREPIVYADKNLNNKQDDNEPVVVMTAKDYLATYKKPAPLSRMLRRQFKGEEYIAITPDELRQLDVNHDGVIDKNDHEGHSILDFVIAVVKNKAGYFATEFQSVTDIAKSSIQLDENKTVLTTHDEKTELKNNEKFIRWLGL
ncbi:MAG: murein L,D-transpeptidase catalytic domain family protein, partial [Coxiellaceae bacterium]|nr:murein L,D-transpeptidase catalytic domain family protein [Coxiellaceae bacterium]